MAVIMKVMFLASLMLALPFETLAQRCGQDFGSCPNDICCSHAGYCGISDAHCISDCQEQYGTCGAPVVPNCDVSRNTAGCGRKVGYYQAFASERSCNNMRPKDIGLDGYTHAVFAFAKFDSKTFEITDESSVNDGLYKEFTDRKNDNLETWISIGGGSFGHEVWQAMTNNGGSRGAFINSLTNFMDRHGFTGVDLDWEFPQNRDDGRAYVTLVSEMRGAFGGKYGISIALTSDAELLGNFYLHDMHDHIDFFNFMTYDYHTPSRGNTVESHTDVGMCEKSLNYLWKNKMDPSKVNLGLAFYAYSYTLANPSCTHNGCPSAGKGRAEGCTNDPDGVLPLFEIDKILADHNREPYIDREGRVAMLTFDGNQFISFDNEETLAMKVERANELCLGGVMVWALSFAPVGHQPLKRSNTTSVATKRSSSKHKHAMRHARRARHLHARVPSFETSCESLPK